MVAAGKPRKPRRAFFFSGDSERCLNLTELFCTNLAPAATDRQACLVRTSLLAKLGR